MAAWYEPKHDDPARNVIVREFLERVSRELEDPHYKRMTVAGIVADMTAHLAETDVRRLEGDDEAGHPAEKRNTGKVARLASDGHWPDFKRRFSDHPVWADLVVGVPQAPNVPTVAELTAIRSLLKEASGGR